MKIAGIIAEYNPFHTGHAYHIQKTRELTGADYIVVVMSGDFVQRGAPALYSKHLRTRMALLGGADLVFELPSTHACESAEFFAQNAVGLLDGLGCVDGIPESYKKISKKRRILSKSAQSHSPGTTFRHRCRYRNLFADTE